MKTVLRSAVVLALLGAGTGSALASQHDRTDVAVGRIVDMEYHHGYAVVEFSNGRMNVSMDKREMGHYIVGDEIRVDSFGRPLPKLGDGRRPPSDGRRAP